MPGPTSLHGQGFPGSITKEEARRRIPPGSVETGGPGQPAMPGPTGTPNEGFPGSITKEEARRRAEAASLRAQAESGTGPFNPRQKQPEYTPPENWDDIYATETKPPPPLREPLNDPLAPQNAIPGTGSWWARPEPPKVPPPPQPSLGERITNFFDIKTPTGRSHVLASAALAGMTAAAPSFAPLLLGVGGVMYAGGLGAAALFRAGRRLLGKTPTLLERQSMHATAVADTARLRGEAMQATARGDAKLAESLGRDADQMASYAARHKEGLDAYSSGSKLEIAKHEMKETLRQANRIGGEGNRAAGAASNVLYMANTNNWLDVLLGFNRAGREAVSYFRKFKGGSHLVDNRASTISSTPFIGFNMYKHMADILTTKEGLASWKTLEGGINNASFMAAQYLTHRNVLRHANRKQEEGKKTETVVSTIPGSGAWMENAIGFMIRQGSNTTLPWNQAVQKWQQEAMQKPGFQESVDLFRRYIHDFDNARPPRGPQPDPLTPALRGPVSAPGAGPSLPRTPAGVRNEDFQRRMREFQQEHGKSLAYGATGLVLKQITDPSQLSTNSGDKLSQKDRFDFSEFMRGRAEQRRQTAADAKNDQNWANFDAKMKLYEENNTLWEDNAAASDETRKKLAREAWGRMQDIEQEFHVEYERWKHEKARDKYFDARFALGDRRVASRQKQNDANAEQLDAYLRRIGMENDPRAASSIEGVRQGKLNPDVEAQLAKKEAEKLRDQLRNAKIFGSRQAPLAQDPADDALASNFNHAHWIIGRNRQIQAGSPGTPVKVQPTKSNREGIKWEGKISPRDLSPTEEKQGLVANKIIQIHNDRLADIKNAVKNKQPIPPSKIEVADMLVLGKIIVTPEFLVPNATKPSKVPEPLYTQMKPFSESGFEAQAGNKPPVDPGEFDESAIRPFHRRQPPLGIVVPHVPGPGPRPTAPTMPSGTPPPTPQSPLSLGEVKEVRDGDSIVFPDTTKDGNRIANIDAPETKQTGGPAATAYANTLLEGASVLRRFFGPDTTKMKRPVEKLLIPRVAGMTSPLGSPLGIALQTSAAARLPLFNDFSREMVQAGHAMNYYDTTDPDQRYNKPSNPWFDETLSGLQRAANFARRGIWEPNNLPTPPWRWRAGKPAVATPP